MPTSAVRLEREKRKTARESALWSLAQNPAVLEAVMPLAAMIGTYYAGKNRMIQRDVAGCLFGLEAVAMLGRAGVTDTIALSAASVLAAGSYAAAVPPTDGETVLSLDFSSPLGEDGKFFGISADLSSPLGGDGKLFGIPIPWLK